MSVPVQQCQPCLILVPTSRCLVTCGPSLGTASTAGGSCSFGAIPAFHWDLTRFCAAGTALPHQRNCCRRAERASGCYMGIQSILSPALCRAAQATALLQEQHFPVAEVPLCRGSWLTECSDVTSSPQQGGRLHEYQNHLMHWPKPHFLTLPLHKNRSDPLVTTRI